MRWPRCRRAPARTIAAAAGAQERYVREWLGAMTTGRVVEHDPRHGDLLAAGRACGLPHPRRRSGQPGAHDAVHADARRRRAGGRRVLHKGGGVPYSAYPRFHQLMAEDSATVHDAVLVDGDSSAGARPDRAPARRDRRRRHGVRTGPRGESDGCGLSQQPVHRVRLRRRGHRGRLETRPRELASRTRRSSSGTSPSSA